MHYELKKIMAHYQLKKMMSH